MIIETSDNRFYRVTETGQPGLEHVWNGQQVIKDSKIGWRIRVNCGREVPQTLVRKAATRVVED